jgi:hypothetical protein
MLFEVSADVVTGGICPLAEADSKVTQYNDDETKKKED